MKSSGDPPGPDLDAGLRAAGVAAAALVSAGARVGLGSGRAASAFIVALGERVRGGLTGVETVPTSAATERLAATVGLAPGALAEGAPLDLTVDGADEVAPNLDVVKGRGGALVRERIVAASSRRQVIIVGPEKLVSALGERGHVPVEFVPLARPLVADRLRALQLVPSIRMASPGPANQKDPAVMTTENGNWIFDCMLATPLPDGHAARALEAAILAIPGVVDTGLFLGTAERVLVGHPDGRVDVLPREGA